MERPRTVAFWLLALLPTVLSFFSGIGIVGYWTIPAAPLRIEGDLIHSYDPEIGFVPRPNSSARLTNLDRRNGKAITDYSVYTDRRGARVTKRGEQGPDHPDVVSIGCSFTWGHGVENDETFTAKVAEGLGLTSVNLAMASHGTTQAVQLLERHRDLRPGLIIYGFVPDHLGRNIRGCAPSLYPFCLDISRVVVEPDGNSKIIPPRSDGIGRARLHVKAQTEWLDPLTWLTHGVDVAINRVYWRMAFQSSSSGLERAAFEYLLKRMAEASTGMGARLVLVHLLPPGEEVSAFVRQVSARFGVFVLDASSALGTEDSLIPGDGHPSAAGHTRIAEEIIAYVRREGFWPPPR